MITFGPVPSRRLGRSLGINNIPPKICSYACVYCQLGRTLKMQADRQEFYKTDDICRSAQDRATKSRAAGEAIDYLTFVPDGEPTLDINLGSEIEALKGMMLPIAVITNASLVWRRDVRENLLGADWVSLKVDAVKEEAWRRVNRPHASLELSSITEGALRFAKAYKGKLVTETMLVAGINDGEEEITAVAGFLSHLQPAVAYLSIPTRPPGEKWVRAPEERVINRAYQLLSEQVQSVEYLIGYEGNAFAFTGDVEQDLLSITSVHPMRQDAVDAYLERAGANGSVVRQLLKKGELVETQYGDHTFYLRRLSMSVTGR
jgi:wyosine [tRNA(Phe)-imidazoG37] synthetase (radical SAM superfamily)